MNDWSSHRRERHKTLFPNRRAWKGFFRPGADQVTPGVVLALKRMNRPVILEQNSAQVGMVFKRDADQIVSLAFVPFDTAPQVRNAHYDRCRILNVGDDNGFGFGLQALKVKCDPQAKFHVRTA